MVYKWSDSINKMFGFIRKMFIATMTFVGCGGLISSNPLKLVSSNQGWKIRPARVNINSTKPFVILHCSCK